MKISIFKTPEQVNRDIAERLKLRRKEQSISQVELSRLSNVSLGSIKRFERTGEISLAFLVKIAFALQCEDDFEQLFAKKGYRSIQEVIDENR